YRPSIAQPSLKPELFGVTIQVRPGDTIDTIARRFETSASIVAAMNDLSTTSPLVIGATIIVPSEEDHKAIEGLQ
ncbi:MAG: LysM domain-containing protein, partial [Hyphomicrobium sp.]